MCFLFTEHSWDKTVSRAVLIKLGPFKDPTSFCFVVVSLICMPLVGRKTVEKAAWQVWVEETLRGTYYSSPLIVCNSGSATLSFVERQEIIVSFYTQDKVNELDE